MGIDERTALLLGSDGVRKLHQATVAVFGLGGVGGTAFEALSRAGIGTLYAIDCDVVDETNLNRQILFSRRDVGCNKAEVAQKRVLSIREDVKVIPESYTVSADSLLSHDYSSCDYLLDCLDDIGAKAALIEYAKSRAIPLIVSLGMGNRIDATKVIVTSLEKTQGDPLAKKLRKVLRDEKIDLSAVLVVFSTEAPINKGAKPSSLMMVPSSAGLAMASRVIDFLEKR
ncbi:MAG: ThiF family adenylyltransferase [Bacilli bacterium]|jgi:tRNA A37 threonylcarbamoyladenosine dehydratase|nr:ThiF family adenylyltransferase [Bacilli bacterium]